MKTNKQKSTTLLLIIKIIFTVIGLFFLLVSFGVFTSPFNVYEFLTYTDFHYLIQAQKEEVPTFIYICIFFFFLTAIVLGIYIVNILYMFIVKKRPPKHFENLAKTVNYSHDYLLKKVIHPIIRSIQRMLLALVITASIWGIFTLLGFWPCETTVISGGTETLCPPTEQKMALLLAVLILVWTLIPPKLLKKIYSKTKLNI